MAYAQETLTIANGGTTSGVISLPERAATLIIETPATLTGTVTLEGSLDGTNFKAIYSGGSAVTLAANGIHTVSPVEANKIRLVSGSAEDAARSFIVKVD
jgi:hypothetical protein